MQHLLSSASYLLHFMTSLRPFVQAGTRTIRVETDTYSLEGKAAIERISLDLKAGRLTRFRLFDSELGNRDVEVNYHGK
ncbi:hypothetical protein [Pararobbsia silviterrae]|uniref:Uncharacterized protein n=1 Tax=Pararobbsia silviterrae TaxID=1792498 RepID=A0A494XJ11_9BURK|nr:hypothetical protein [Pararobbsia silviterrae]RKP49752.1 hypothetical protein D7S86_20975 [Pararobbsia silviterrae]